MDNVYFVMPAYNEAENIESTIQQWYPVVEKNITVGGVIQDLSLLMTVVRMTHLPLWKG